MVIDYGRRAALFACALALLALFGCTLQDQESNPLGTSDIISGQALTVPKYADPGKEICREIPGDKPCYCMSCTNTSYSGPLAWLLSGLFDNTLAGGTCSISPCNASDYQRIVEEDNDTQMRTFAIGAGQSFASTGIANTYCNYSLQFATKWMKGGEGAPPRVPLASRAKCWLDRSTLPIYIYYTGGKGIDPARTWEIAQAFEAADAGPALITTEVGWDGLDSGAAQLIRQQVLAIDSCDKCLTVLAVQPGDYHALAAIMGAPGSLDHNYYDKIDAVGFGFRANDYPDCNIDRAIGESLKFSRYILQNYSKPTIWLYVGASEGNGSAGGPDTGGCSLTKNDVHDFYSQLLARTSGLASSGVLGMSAYEFVDGSGPLPCLGGEGCDFGMLLANGSQKHPELNAWSDMCQQVNMNSLSRRPLIFSRNGQGYACDLPGTTFSSQARMYEAARIASSQGLLNDTVWGWVKEDLGCGEVCPGNGSSMPKPDIYDSTGNGFNGSHCSIYPVIDERADDMDISSTYMRAIIEQESKFDPWAVSCNTASCGAPLGTTMEEICVAAGYEPDCDAHTLYGDGKTCPQDKPYFCAYGMAQCIELPGQYYVKNNKAIPDAIKGCGAESYNPFDPGMSACCGATKFASFLRDGAGVTAEKWVNANWAELSKCAPDGLSEDERGWAAYYIASNMYYGEDWNVLSQFKAQRDNGGECQGSEKNYIAYLRKYDTSPLPGTMYGAQVMSRYRVAADACDSDCPR